MFKQACQILRWYKLFRALSNRPLDCLGSRHTSCMFWLELDLGENHHYNIQTPWSLFLMELSLILAVAKPGGYMHLNYHSTNFATGKHSDQMFVHVLNLSRYNICYLLRPVLMVA